MVEHDSPQVFRVKAWDECSDECFGRVELRAPMSQKRDMGQPVSVGGMYKTCGKKSGSGVCHSEFLLQVDGHREEQIVLEVDVAVQVAFEGIQTIQ